MNSPTPLVGTTHVSSDIRSQVPRVIAVEEHAWNPGLRAALLEFGGDDTVTWLSAPAITSDRLLDCS